MIEIAYKGTATSTIIFFNVYKNCWRYLRKGDQLQDINVDGRILLKFFFTKWDGGIDWTDPVQDRKRSNESSGFIKCKELPD
jgi:hypothetical protein